MNPWPETNLGKLVRIKHGFAFKGEYFSNAGKYLLLTPGNLHPSGGLKLKGEKEIYYTGPVPAEFILSKGDLVIVMTDLTQEASILGGAMQIDRSELYLHNQRLGLVTLAADVDRRFLYHYFNWQYFRDQVKASSNGATVKHTSPGRIYKCRIMHPALSVQRKVAAILSAYDELIENNKQRIALLEKLAEEIYREWFVRLRFPGYESSPSFRGVPDGWSVRKFGEFCQLKRGYDLPDSAVEPGPYPVVASTSIKTFHSSYKVDPPVITTGRSGSLGHVMFVSTRAWPLNTALYVKNFFGNSPFLVFHTLKSMKLENFNAGAGVPTLNRNHLNGLPIVVPKKSVQERFNDNLAKIHSQVELLGTANQKLLATRDVLLPRLLSGKLSVENLDIQFPPGMAEEVEAERDASNPRFTEAADGVISAT